MEVKDAPVSYASAHDDLIYVVYDAHVTDSTTYPNYKYIADVYIDGTLVARLKRVQDPVNGFGVFNIGQIVRNYLSVSFNPSPSILVSQILADVAFFVDVVVKFGEEYSDTDYLNVLIDFTRRIFNHYNGRLVGAATALNLVQNSFATNSPLMGKVLLTSTHFLVPYFPTTTGSVTATITTNNGSSFSTAFNPNAHELNILNLSPVTLNAIHAGAITAATTSYVVQIGVTIYTIYVICEPLYSPYMVHFLNQYSGFESFLFPKVSRTKYSIEGKDFGKLNYSIDASGVVNYKTSNGIYYENRSVYSKQFVEKLTLNSDLLTDAEYLWLRDLIVSPMVYIQEGSYFFPIVITAADYEPKKAINDDLTNLTIDVEYGRTLNSQYR